MKSNEKYSFKSLIPIQSYFSSGAITKDYKSKSPQILEQINLQDSQICINSWEKYLREEQEKHNQLKGKVKTMQESVDIYKQSIALKNEQILNLEMKGLSLIEKLMMLQKKIHVAQQRHKKIGQGCHEAKAQIQTIQCMITKEENILSEQQRHADEIFSRMKSMQSEINNSYSELDHKSQLYTRYKDEVQMNKELKEKVTCLSNNLAILQHHQSQSQKEESIIRVKSEQLMKIVEMRENRNKILSKKLTELKRLQCGEPQRKLCPKELSQTLVNLERNHGDIYDQMISLKNKIEILHEKIKEKNQSIEKMQEQESSGSLTKYDRPRVQPHAYNIIESEGEEQKIITGKSGSNPQQGMIPRHNIEYYIEDTDEQNSNHQFSLSQSAKELIDRYERVTQKNKY